MRTAPCLLALLCLACGPSFEPRAASGTQPFIEIKVSSLEPGDVYSARGQTLTVSDPPQPEEGFFRLRIPAESLGLGTHTVDVQLDRGGRKTTRSLEVTVSPESLNDYLQIGPCVRLEDLSDIWTAQISSEVWYFEGGGKSCPANGNNQPYPVNTNADAKLAIAGVPVITSNGRGVWTTNPFALLSSQLTLGQLESSVVAQDVLKATVPIRLERPGSEPHTYSVTFASYRSTFRRWIAKHLRATSPGSPPVWLPVLDTTAKANAKAPAATRGLVMVTEYAKIKVDGKERQLIPAGYHPLRVSGPKDIPATDVDLFATASPLDVVRWKGKCYFNVGMPPRHAIYGLGYEVVVRDRAGKEVERKTFPRPKKTRCPKNISGAAGETTILWNPPDSSRVLAWLDEVRTATAQTN